MSVVMPSPKFAWKTKVEYADKNPPVQNTEYTLFDETGGVRLVSISLVETNTETDAKDIDLIITKDGAVYTYDASSIGGLTHNQIGCFTLRLTALAGSAWALDLTQNIAIPTKFVTTDEGGKPLEAHDLKAVLKMTSAAGTAQRLKYTCVYETLEAV